MESIPAPESVKSHRFELEAISCALAFVLLASQVSAQFDQFVSPGGSPGERHLDRSNFETALEESRWQLGPLRLDPWIGISDAAFVSNVFATGGSETTDYTASFGAGLRGYLPLADHGVISLHALPEYVWWGDQEERRQLNGRYGAGLFFFSNRLTFNLTGTSREQQQFFSAEVQQLTHSRRDTLAATFDLQIKGALHLFASASETDVSDELDEAVGGDFDLLDRNERVIRGGLGLEFLDRVRLRFGIEDVDVQFDQTALNRDNSGTGPAIEIDYQGPTFDASLDLVQRSLEPGPGSSFVAFDGVTGKVQLDLLPDAGITPSVYGANNVVFALDQSFAYFEDQRLGLRLRIQTAGNLQVFAEVGTNDYTPLSGVTARREDDLTSYGGSLNFNLARTLNLQISSTTTEYESNLAQFDRRISTFGINFGLSIGTEGVGWP